MSRSESAPERATILNGWPFGHRQRAFAASELVHQLEAVARIGQRERPIRCRGRQYRAGPHEFRCGLPLRLEVAPHPYRLAAECGERGGPADAGLEVDARLGNRFDQQRQAQSRPARLEPDPGPGIRFGLPRRPRGVPDHPLHSDFPGQRRDRLQQAFPGLDGQFDALGRDCRAQLLVARGEPGHLEAHITCHQNVVGVRGRLVDMGMHARSDQPFLLGHQQFRLAGNHFDRIALLVENERVARQRTDPRNRKVVGRQAAPAVGVPDDLLRRRAILVDEEGHRPRLRLQALERDRAALAPPAVLIRALLLGRCLEAPVVGKPEYPRQAPLRTGGGPLPAPRFPLARLERDLFDPAQRVFPPGDRGDERRKGGRAQVLMNAGGELRGGSGSVLAADHLCQLASRPAAGLPPAPVGLQALDGQPPVSVSRRVRTELQQGGESPTRIILRKVARPTCGPAFEQPAQRRIPLSAAQPSLCPLRTWTAVKTPSSSRESCRASRPPAAGGPVLPRWRACGREPGTAGTARRRCSGERRCACGWPARSDAIASSMYLAAIVSSPRRVASSARVEASRGAGGLPGARLFGSCSKTCQGAGVVAPQNPDERDFGRVHRRSALLRPYAFRGGSGGSAVRMISLKHAANARSIVLLRHLREEVRDAGPGEPSPINPGRFCPLPFDLSKRPATVLQRSSSRSRRRGPGCSNAAGTRHHTPARCSRVSGRGRPAPSTTAPSGGLLPTCPDSRCRRRCLNRGPPYRRPLYR